MITSEAGRIRGTSAILFWTLIIIAFGLCDVCAKAQTYYNYYVVQSSDYNSSDGVKYVAKGYNEWMKKGDPKAAAMYAFETGLCYLDGRLGPGERQVRPDERQAMEWFQKAGDFWQGGATGYVGYRFLGQGSPSIEPNAQQAEHWLLIAAKGLYGGDPSAQYNLGLAYLKGDVIPKDEVKALQWLLVAAKQNDAHAVLLLGELYHDGKVVPRNEQLSQQALAAAPALFSAEQAKYAAALADKQQSDQNLAQILAQIKSQGNADMLNSVANGLSTIPTTATAPSIQTTTNQQLANIQAKQAGAQASQAAKPSQVAKASPPPQLHPTTQLNQAPSSGEAEAPISTAAAPATPCPTANSGLLETQPCVPASCISMNHVVHLQSEIFAAAPKEEREVVGYFTNNSISDVTCTWAFHKDGQWAEIGTGYVKKGATHQGGQGGGIWTVGADSFDMKYSCFMGLDPVDAQGHYCTLGVVFSGQTSAGTDIR